MKVPASGQYTLPSRHPFIKWARLMLMEPSTWKTQFDLVRSYARSEENAIATAPLIRACEDDACLVSEPDMSTDIAFIVSSMVFAFCQVRPVVDACQAGLWALGHPLSSRQYIPVRIMVCNELLKMLTPSEDNLRYHVAVESELAWCYARSMARDRVANQERALRICSKAIRRLGATDDPNLAQCRFQLLTRLGNIYRERRYGEPLGNLRKAVRCFVDAKVLMEHAGICTPRRLATALGNLGSTLVYCAHRQVSWDSRALMDLTRARAPSLYIPPRVAARAKLYLSTAVSLFSSEGLTLEWAEASLNLGNVLTLLALREPTADLRPAIACYHGILKALGCLPTSDSRELYSQALANLGAVHALQGHYSAAIACLKRCLVLTAKWDLRHAALRACIQLGIAQVDANLLATARQSFVRAESLLEKVADQEWTSAGFRALLQREAPIYDGLMFLAIVEGDAETAADCAERGRDRLVRSGFPQVCNQRASRKRRPPVASCERPSTQANSLADASQAAILTLRPTQWGTCAVVALPDGRVLSHCVPHFKLKDVHQLLSGSKNRPAWFSSYSRFRQDARDLSHRYFQSHAAWLSTMETTLRSLGQRLWKPIRDWVDQYYPARGPGVEPLPMIILPGMGLNVLPIHAADTGSACPSYACDDYQISYASSMHALEKCQLRQARTSLHWNDQLLLLCPSAGGHPDWPRLEADYVARWAEARQTYRLEKPADLANSDLVLKAITKATLAVFSMHSVWDPVDVMASCLYADTPENPEGQGTLSLSIRKLRKLDLSRLWLIVLSSCESSLSDFADPAVNGLGLTSALIQAGATTALGTLWMCHSEAAALLVSRLFEEIRRSIDAGTPVSKASALWRAQRWLRGRGLWKHPFFWAAFACYGAR